MLSPRKVSLVMIAASLFLALVCVLLGRRVNTIDHFRIFNTLAAWMLALVAAALVVSAVALVRVRGRSPSLWLTALLAVVILGAYLLADWGESRVKDPAVPRFNDEQGVPIGPGRRGS